MISVFSSVWLTLVKLYLYGRVDTLISPDICLISLSLTDVLQWLGLMYFSIIDKGATAEAAEEFVFLIFR